MTFYHKILYFKQWFKGLLLILSIVQIKKISFYVLISTVRQFHGLNIFGVKLIVQDLSQLIYSTWFLYAMEHLA